MIEIGVAEAQKSFIKLLNEPTTIVDKKSNIKRAVVLPYFEYEKLINRYRKELAIEIDSEIEDFVGILSKDFKSDDEKYNHIVKKGHN